MKFGLFSMNTGSCSYPEAAIQIAQAAESAGFESLWVSDHIVFPDPPIARFPTPPESRLIEPLTMLTFLAGHTQQVKLGTGVIVLPQRNPLVLAKQVASVDELTKGRLIFGFGVGHLEPEFEAIGIPFNERGARTDEYLSAMLSLWSDAKPAYQGNHVSFANVQAHPQREIPLVVGGYAPAALRRTVQRAHGWYGFARGLEATKQSLAGLRKAATEVERPAHLGELEISVSPPRGKIDRQTIQSYADLGVHRLILIPPTEDLAERISFVREVAELF
ncbi:MAG: LLM class F420-dependent oxidoreductase [Chloroflexota bacterium]